MILSGLLNGRHAKHCNDETEKSVKASEASVAPYGAIANQIDPGAPPVGADNCRNLSWHIVMRLQQEQLT